MRHGSRRGKLRKRGRDEARVVLQTSKTRKGANATLVNKQVTCFGIEHCCGRAAIILSC